VLTAKSGEAQSVDGIPVRLDGVRNKGQKNTPGMESRRSGPRLANMFWAKLIVRAMKVATEMG
jgi:hypothetical protein